VIDPAMTEPEGTDPAVTDPGGTGPIESPAGAAPVVRTIGVALSVNCVTTLPYILLGAAAVQVTDDLGFDEAALGVILSGFSVGGLVSSPVAGLITERIGPSQGLRLASGLTAVAVLAVALLGRSWWSLAAIMLFGGAASGLTAPAANAWVSQAVPSRRRGLAFGIKQSASPMASVLGGLSVPLIMLTAGWRWAFVAAAVLTLAVAASVPSLSPRRPEGPAEHRRAPVHRAALGTLTVGIGLAFFAQSPLQSFYVSSSVDAGMDEGAAGVLLATGGVAAVVTRVVAGVVADRWPRGFLRTVAAMLVLGALSYVVMAVGGTTLIMLATPLVFATVAGWVGLVHLAVVQSHPDAAALATGIIMLGAFGGVVVGPAIFGALARHSYTTAWLAFGAVMVVGAGIVMAARSQLRAGVLQAQAAG
jgi:predicted MFS family arabinose efflux permease